ncbi:MAG: metalloregulator ArsR/SmtB family transcription factor [bacterium]|nr:metalloregulator ArsR/SmtB family transcription factor [bacterium]
MRKIVKPARTFGTKPHSSPPSTLQSLQKEIFSSKIKESAEWINLLNSETRLQLLLVLWKKDSLCVGDLADVVRLNISAVSHQLRLLKDYNLVSAKRKKKVVYYSLARGLPGLINHVLQEAG